jgi:hypothetical protein
LAQASEHASPIVKSWKALGSVRWEHAVAVALSNKQTVVALTFTGNS